MSVFDDQFETVQMAIGFIAALDQSGGSTPKALKLYGVEESEYNGDDEMFGKIHEMRTRIMTNEAFTGEHILGAILFENTCLLYTSPSPRDKRQSRMPSSA